MPLCDLCKGINVNSVVPFCPPECDDSEPSDAILQICYQHHRSFDNLRNSAKLCEMCHLMFQALEDSNQDQPDVDEDFTTSEQSYIWLISGENMFFDLTLPKRLSQLRINVGGYGRIKSVDLLLYTDPDDPLSASGDIVGRRPASHADSVQVRSLMKYWFSECLDNHDLCGRNPGRSDPVVNWRQSFPARLLSLNANGSTELIETDNADYQYAALSYCWGKSHPVVTTRENYGQLIHGFGKTLRDAIQIVVDLGLRYLWVDALCIIQDDKDDWQKEASKMAAIYRNAQVTVSATGASDTSIGCLIPRSAPSVEPVDLLSGCSNSEFVGHMKICPKVGTIDEVLDRSPLNNRGWCLQERVLSRRIVHFAQDQLYWECETLSQAEDGTVLGVTSNFKRLLSKADTEQTTLRAWHALVEDYSQRLLTQGSDIFPALAGLADAVRQRLTDPEYCAGIWKQDLPFGLLWSTPVAKMATISSSRRAPTWSWAAVSGPITSSLRTNALGINVDRVLADVVEIRTSLRNPSFSLGEVDGGILTLCSRIRDIRLPSVGRSYAQRPWKPSDGQMIVLDDAGNDVGDMTFDDHTHPYPTTLTVIMICSGINLSRKIDRYPTSCFLALESAGTVDTYKRVGAGQVRDNTFFDGSPQVIVKII